MDEVDALRLGVVEETSRGCLEENDAKRWVVAEDELEYGHSRRGWYASSDDSSAESSSLVQESKGAIETDY